jgi:hypothetical protein
MERVICIHLERPTGQGARDVTFSKGDHIKNRTEAENKTRNLLFEATAACEKLPHSLS